MKITVTGSLGNISKPLSRRLIDEGHEVTIISSDAAREHEINTLGATPAIGSIEDENFLTAVLEDTDAVYCMTPPKFAAPDQVAYYAHTAECYAIAIAQSNVKRVLYLSSYGAHLPSGTGYITGSYKAENILNQLSDIHLTHIRPTYFYYNLLHFISMIKQAGFMGNVFGGNDKLAMVAPQDIADAIAEAITKPKADKIIYVASDDRTCNEVAQVLGNAVGIPSLQWKVLPPQQVQATLVANGMSENAAANLVDVGISTHTGVLRETFDMANPKYGKTKLEDFAMDFATKYNQNKNDQ